MQNRTFWKRSRRTELKLSNSKKLKKSKNDREELHEKRCVSKNSKIKSVNSPMERAKINKKKYEGLNPSFLKMTKPDFELGPRCLQRNPRVSKNDKSDFKRLLLS